MANCDGRCLLSELCRRFTRFVEASRFIDWLVVPVKMVPRRVRETSKFAEIYRHSSARLCGAHISYHTLKEGAILSIDVTPLAASELPCAKFFWAVGILKSGIFES